VQGFNLDTLSQIVLIFSVIAYAFKGYLTYLLTCLSISICIYISIKVPHLYLFDTFEVMYFTPVLAGFCGMVYITFKTNYFKQRALNKGELIISSILPMVFTALFMYFTDKYLDTTVTLIQDILTVILSGEIGLISYMNNTGSGNASGNVNSTTSASGSQPTGSNTGAPLLAFGFSHQQWCEISKQLEVSVLNIVFARESMGNNNTAISYKQALSNSHLSLQEKRGVRSYYFSRYTDIGLGNPIWGDTVGRTEIRAIRNLARSTDQPEIVSDDNWSDS